MGLVKVELASGARNSMMRYESPSRYLSFISSLSSQLWFIHLVAKGYCVLIIHVTSHKYRILLSQHP